jgi:hypothetical protein
MVYVAFSRLFTLFEDLKLSFKVYRSTFWNIFAYRVDKILKSHIINFACGRSSIGRTLPCQGRGLWVRDPSPALKCRKAFFYKKVLLVDKGISDHYNSLCSRRRGQVGRQGSAKPSSRVQIPSSPQKRQEIPVFLFSFCCYCLLGDSICLFVKGITCMSLYPSPFDFAV